MSTVDDAKDEFMHALEDLDTLLTKDPYQREILWKVIENFILGKKSTDDLTLTLNKIFGSSVGHVIEYILQDHQITNEFFVENNTYNNSSYFIALSEVFIPLFRKKKNA